MLSMWREGTVKTYDKVTGVGEISRYDMYVCDIIELKQTTLNDSFQIFIDNHQMVDFTYTGFMIFRSKMQEMHDRNDYIHRILIYFHVVQVHE